LQNIPKNKATLILSNHQNALLDALLLATQLPQFSYFLTRASVFKNPLVSQLLKSLNMLPVYRIRDGWSKLMNNNSIFHTCSSILAKKGTVVIFPEGNHNLDRRVRPLSKGFTRIVYETIEDRPEIDLQLLPVGLNYINARNFVDAVSVYIGKPMDAKFYCSESKNEDIVRLKNDVHDVLSKLTTHIPEKSYAITLQKLEELGVNFLDPISVNFCISNGFENCKRTTRLKIKWLHTGLKGLLILNLLLPYLIWKFAIQPKVDEIEFISTFRFSVAVTLVPIYLLIIAIVISSFFGIEIAIYYVCAVLLLELLIVKV
jgi:1-acyl-sn-glycerol-3-phosphate acyltransferase